MVTYLGLAYIPNCTHTHTYLTILKLYPQTRFQPSLFVNEWVVCLSLETHSLPPHSKTGQDRWFPSNHLDRITETGFGDTQIYIYKYMKLYTQPRFQPSLFVNEWVVCLSLQTHSLPPHSKTGQDRWFPSNHLDRITETGFGDTQIYIYKYMKLYTQPRFQPSLFVNEWVVCLSLQTHSLPPHSKTGQDRWFPSNHLDRITETGFGDTQIYI